MPVQPISEDTATATVRTRHFGECDIGWPELKPLRWLILGLFSFPNSQHFSRMA
jgi:hypothetical protein